PFTTTVASILRVLGNDTSANAVLTFATGFTNNGTIELTNTGAPYSAALTVQAGTLVNVSIINLMPDGGGPRIVNAPLLVNHGDIYGAGSLHADVENAGQMYPSATGAPGIL